MNSFVTYHVIFSLSGCFPQYGLLIESDQGSLSSQNTRYLGFKRICFSFTIVNPPAFHRKPGIFVVLHFHKLFERGNKVHSAANRH